MTDEKDTKKEEDKFLAATEHGKLEKIFDNVYLVQGSFRLGPGMVIGRTMTIIQRGSDLTIVNSLRVSDEVESEILKLGEIKHLIRMNSAHGCDDAYYINKFKPKYWQTETLKDKCQDGAPHDQTLNETSLPLEDMKFVPVLEPNATHKNKLGECMLWIPDEGGTLLTCDFLQNTIEISPYCSFVGNLMTKYMGFVGECNCCWLYRNLTKGSVDYWATCEKLFALPNFENLITSHGQAKIGGAKAMCETNLKTLFECPKAPPSEEDDGEKK